jgi:predicted ATPase
VARVELPAGTVTFLFTDVEGSTRLLHELGAEVYAAALAEHRRVVREACAGQGGVEVDTQGDAFFVAFPTAPGALAAATEIAEGLQAGSIRVRMGLHTGTPLVTEEGYVGPDVHRAARIAAAGHGGQVLVSSSTASLLEGVTLRDLGEHRFKDLAAAERVYQLGDSDFPVLQSLYRTNLPVPATRFLGRERELAEIVALLSRRDVRLVTLTGPGGTGKTRLALQAAAEVAQLFPDGVWWVALAALRDPTLVLTTVAQAVDATEAPGRTPGQTLASALSGKQCVLLLDNAEHLLPEVAADIARLRDLDGPTLLVTTRERLQLHGEHAWAVPGLDEDDAVELFSVRARALDPSFASTAGVADLCERLDQLPLALELAAARTVVFSPAQLLERLSERLDLLKGGRDADPRQQTLRATIEWSYELLPPAEQGLFRGLAVFVAGSTYEAAERVCGADPDLLQSLLDKSLLRQRETAGGRRYWMLETIREYAVERLAATGELGALRGQHARYFLEQADERDERRFSIAHPEGLAWLSAERGNLFAALDWTRETGADALFAVGARVMCTWWLQTGWARQGLHRIDAVLARRANLPRGVIVDLLIAASDLARFTGDEDRALALFRELLDLVRDNDLLRATSNADMAEILIQRGELDEAEAHLLESLRLGGGVRAKASLAELELARGDYEAAYALAKEAEVGFRGVHAYNLLATQEILGEIARRRGDGGKARTWFARAARGAAELGDKGLVADCLDGLAAVAADAGDVGEADRLAGIAAALRDAAGIVPYRQERVRQATLVPYGISLDQAIEQTIGGLRSP